MAYAFRVRYAQHLAAAAPLGLSGTITEALPENRAGKTAYEDFDYSTYTVDLVGGGLKILNVNDSTVRLIPAHRIYEVNGPVTI